MTSNLKHVEATRIAIDAVIAERDAQDAKWGEQNHRLPVWFTILAEEFGEAAKEALGAQFAKDAGDVQRSLDACRTELVQVAAVATAMVEYLDRRGLAA